MNLKKLSMFSLEGDMARRRGQRKGYLTKQGPSWIGQWREDVRSADGQTVQRAKFSRAVAVAKGEGAVSKRQAQRIFYDEVLAKLDTLSIHSGSMATLREFVAQRFEPDVVFKQRSRHYTSTLKPIMAALGGQRLRDLSPEVIQRFLSGKLETLSVQSVVHLRNTLTRIFKHAKRRGYFAGEIPTEYVELPRMRRKHRGALAPEHVRSIADLLESPYSEFFLLLALAGLRAGEALGLVWKYVNLSFDTIFIDGQAIPSRCVWVCRSWRERHYTDVKTERSQGIVPLAKQLAERLALLKNGSRWAGPDDPLFSVRNGKPFEPSTACAKKLKPILRELGLSPDITWHWGRHTLANLSDEVGGMTEAQRQKLMRHASVDMTRHYTHADLEKARAGLDAVAEAVLGDGHGRVM